MYHQWFKPPDSKTYESWLMVNVLIASLSGDEQKEAHLYILNAKRCKLLQSEIFSLEIFL